MLEPRLALTAFVVNSLVDDASGAVDGQISLREAVIAANTNAAFGDAPAGESTDDTITFDLPSGSVYELTEGRIDILEGLTIRGGSSDLTINAGGRSRIFVVNAIERVSISKLRLVEGRASRGAAIFAAPSSDLFVYQSIFESNFATEDGAAIYMSEGKLISNGSEFLSNESDGAVVFLGDSESVFLASNFDAMMDPNSVETGAMKIDGGWLFARDTVVDSRFLSESDFNEYVGGIDVSGSARVSLVNYDGITEGKALEITGPAEVYVADSEFSSLGTAVTITEGGKLSGKTSEFCGCERFYSLDIDHGTVSIRDSSITSTGIVARNSRVSVFDSEIIYLQEGSPGVSGNDSFVLIDNTNVRIAFVHGSESELIIRNNSYVTAGQFGAIHNVGGKVYVENSRIYGTSIAVANGGAFSSTNGTVIVVGSTIEGGVDMGVGGAFYLQGGAAYIRDSQVNVSGDVAFVTEGATFSASNSTLKATRSNVFGFVRPILDAENGSRIYVNDSELATDEQALKISNGIAVLSNVSFSRLDSDSSSHGDRVTSLIESVDSNLYFRNTTVSGLTFDGNGGVINAKRGFTEVSNSHFSDLTISASEQQFGGGAIQVLGGSLRVTDSTFRNNSSNTNGVASSIWMGADTFSSITNSVFEGNRSPYGGAIVSHGFVVLQSSRFVGNEASFNGGALYSVASSRTRITDTLFSENRAERLGGGLFSLGVTELTDSTFERNVANDKGAFFAERRTLSGNHFVENTPNDF